ncbi:N-acetylmuramoyl-L-alanine amidase [Iningainema tapete]|uniref:N-acetylmuramoyl-L-alanine amidase n=1 Tax=Iningainema tapete BLCC-T55 TaxID=2748662 RepID=A0A8J6XH42_9CYAN|nr:N-acetylmuramoyl-L-alanine amidase [Iningainema tapete BLCC-T55]
MKLHWLLPGTLVTIFMLLSPAHAARLQSWRFDVNQNRLEIDTEGSVQPRARLMFNPTRLVIDLPDTTLGELPPAESPGRGIRSIRAGQFDAQTARIVVELDPGYTMNPDMVQFIGVSANRWNVQLPKPQIKITDNSEQQNVYNLVTTDSENKLRSELLKVASTTTGATQIDNFQITGDGFFIRTSGEKAKIPRVSRSRDRRTIYMDIPNASVGQTTQRDLPVGKYGVNSILLNQLNTKPPTVRVEMRVDKDSPDWKVSSDSSGLVVLPTVGTGNILATDNTTPTPSRLSENNLQATIESVQLVRNDTQLIVKGDRRILANGSWDRSSGFYRIVVPNAKLAVTVRGPVLNERSPILRIRLQQEDPNNVVIYVQPAAGVRIGQLNRDNQAIALDLQRNRRLAPLPSSLLPPISRPYTQSFPNPLTNNPQPYNPPRPTNGRVAVVIDPGHGGKDPGAIGLGGVREKDIILPVSTRIAEILQQNGISVVLTRNSDYFVSLQGRVDIAQQVSADMFVSIHANSAGLNRPDVSGLEVYYYDSGLGLANTVHDNILRSVNVRDRGVRKARFYVLRRNSMPAILVELGYLTGQEDAAKLSNPQYQYQMAEAIANGILQYLRQR